MNRGKICFKLVSFLTNQILHKTNECLSVAPSFPKKQTNQKLIEFFFQIFFHFFYHNSHLLLSNKTQNLIALIVPLISNYFTRRRCVGHASYRFFCVYACYLFGTPHCSGHRRAADICECYECPHQPTHQLSHAIGDPLSHLQSTLHDPKN